MKKANDVTTQLKRYIIPAVLGGVMFLSLTHHWVNGWELAAVNLLLLFLIVVPVLSTGLYWLGAKLGVHISHIPKTRFVLFCMAALLIASFITWRTYHVPASYQTITITPKLTQDQTLDLVELKANGDVLPLQPAALQSQWQKVDGTFHATQHSQPLRVSFKSPANAPISLLFGTSPQSGEVIISFGNRVVESDLRNMNTGQSVIRFTASYRGIPNGIFIPAVILMDIITFSVVILLLLIVQELGQARPASERTSPLRADLGPLLALGFILHLLNLLSVPLIMDGDSPAYLQGAASFLKQGNLDGASRVVGPGTTFLFAPVLFLFGRNPWGIKILLHLLALACIPVCYRLGWQISRNRTVAFLSGLVAVVTPDVYLYSNYVMSDILNILLVLLFCTLLISALETRRPQWMFALFLTGAFANLLRSENILLLVIGTVALVAEYLRLWLQDRDLDLKKPALYLGLGLIVAILPVLWWSSHNKRLHGFFGMSNYLGVVLYDGWVFYGDASHLAFSDRNSESAQKIEQATAQYPIQITDKTGVATGWETYPALIEAGYTAEEAMSLLQGAALDSIRRNKTGALELLLLKFRAGLRPEITHYITYSLPGEPAWTTEAKLEYFDAENVTIPFLIRLHRQLNDLIAVSYQNVGPVWVLFCVLALTLSLFRRPTIPWLALIAIIASRVFIPLTLSVPFWRYALSGWLPLQIVAISWVLILINGGQRLFHSALKTDRILP